MNPRWRPSKTTLSRNQAGPAFRLDPLQQSLRFMLTLGVWQVTNLSLQVCWSLPAVIHCAALANHEFINLGIAPKLPGPSLAYAGGPGDLCQFCFQEWFRTSGILTAAAR